MQFEYSNAPQKSPEWFKIRRGRVTASRLSDWLSVSKAKTGAGKPLKGRLDYEKELMFERQFDTSFSVFVNDAMQDGIDFEGFAADEYQKLHPKWTMEEVGCWYNDKFVASPDRTVNDDGLLEVKIVRDNTFTEILVSGVPDKHWKQIQGQLFATGRAWCDYIALNFNTKKFIVIRVEPDKEFYEYLELALNEELVTEQFALTNVHEIQAAIPEWSDSPAKVDHSDSNTNNGGWA
jgi:predicted phage-related endonuclease